MRKLLYDDLRVNKLRVFWILASISCEPDLCDIIEGCVLDYDWV